MFIMFQSCDQAQAGTSGPGHHIKGNPPACSRITLTLTFDYSPSPTGITFRQFCEAQSPNTGGK